MELGRNLVAQWGMKSVSSRQRMGATLRQAWIAALARLRLAGPFPWVVFVGWAGFCVAQEPASLRAFGIHLREPGIACAAATLWVICVAPKTWEPKQARVRFAALLLLLLAVALAAGGLLLLADGILVDRRGLGGVRLAWAVLLALVPVSLALANSREPSQELTQSILRKILMAFSCGPAAAVLMAPWLALRPVTVFAASGLSICASLLLMIARCGEQGPCLPARKQT